MFWLNPDRYEEKEEKSERISTKDLFHSISLLPSEKQIELDLMGNRLPLAGSAQSLDEQAVEYQKVAEEWRKACDDKNLTIYAKRVLLEMRVLYFHRTATGFLKNHLHNQHGMSQALDLITYEKYLLAESTVINLCYLLNYKEIFSRIEDIYETTSIAKEHFEALAIGNTLIRAAINASRLSYPPILLQVLYALAAEHLRCAIDQKNNGINELFALYRKATEKSWELAVQLKDEFRKGTTALDLSYCNQVEKSAGDEVEFLSARLLAKQAEPRRSAVTKKNIDNIETVTPQPNLRKVNKFRHKQ